VKKTVSDNKRRKGESFEGFMRRVKQRWIKSGRILEARKVKTFQKKKSKNQQRESTVSKMQKYSKKLYLQKIGRLPADDKNARKGRRRR